VIFSFPEDRTFAIDLSAQGSSFSSTFSQHA